MGMKIGSAAKLNPHSAAIRKRRTVSEAKKRTKQWICYLVPLVNKKTYVEQSEKLSKTSNL